MITTLKLTENQVQALFHVMGVAKEGYADNMETDEDLGMTLWRNTYKAIDQIEKKLEKEGWS